MGGSRGYRFLLDQVYPGVVLTGCCNGNGIARLSMLGRLAVRLGRRRAVVLGDLLSLPAVLKGMQLTEEFFASVAPHLLGAHGCLLLNPELAYVNAGVEMLAQLTLEG
jgi:hypothetical protein